MVFKRPSRSLEGEKGEFNSHRKTKVCHTVGSHKTRHSREIC